MLDPVAGRRSVWGRIAAGLRSHPTRFARLNVTIWSVVAVLCLTIGLGTAVGSPAHKTTGAAAGGAAPGTSAGHASSPDVTDSALAESTPAPQPSTSSVTVSRPRPADTTGGVTVNAAGAVLPDPHRTPGATNPAVTQGSIDSTICVSGWTSTIRPPSSYTTALKKQQLASGYAYHGDTATADYEEDHLISLEIGGSPDSALNLWPEPYNVADGARVKDVVENKLHALVCAHSISLVSAQRAIATNWWDAYLHYVGATVQVSSTHVAPPPPPPTTSAAPRTTAPAPGLTCSASMSNASPAQYSATDVIVHTAAGATATATAHYKTTVTSHTGTAGSNGVADISFMISRATIGYTVEVDVLVSRSGASSSCSTSFTPH